MSQKVLPPEILYIEDNINDAELAIRALTKNNVTSNIIYLTDSQEALDFIFALGKYTPRDIMEQPRLILLDLKMPKMDGSQILKAIRADERTRGIPVVILTSSKEQKDIKKCFSLGANSYVVKPIEFEKFSQTVAAIGYYWLSLNETVYSAANN